MVTTVLKDAKRSFEALYNDIVDGEGEVERFTKLADAESRRSKFLVPMKMLTALDDRTNNKDVTGLLTQIGANVTFILFELESKDPQIESCRACVS